MLPDKDFLITFIQRVGEGIINNEDLEGAEFNKLKKESDFIYSIKSDDINSSDLAYFGAGAIWATIQLYNYISKDANFTNSI